MRHVPQQVMSGRSRPAPAESRAARQQWRCYHRLRAAAARRRGEAHGVSGDDALFLQGIRGAAIGPLMYLARSTW